MKAFRPLWIALRAAVLATAVFWVVIVIIDKVGWQAPWGATEPVVFFVVLRPVAFRAVVFLRPVDLRAVSHAWVKRKLPGVIIPDGVRQFEGNAI